MNWLRIHVSNLCNFKCPNCHVFELTENVLPGRVMSYEVFEKTIDSYTKILRKMNLEMATISLYGGETLANKKTIKKIIEKFQDCHNGIGLTWLLNTNGSLLNEEDVIFFKKYNVELHVSVDGREEIHNISRPTHKGKGTFKMVQLALEYIKKHSAKAQLNSYVMPSNFEHLKDIVDIAENYHIGKIYLDQFYDLNMIQFNSGLEKYREVYLYSLSKNISLGGPWLKVHSNTSRRENIVQDFALDVNVDGSCYFPIFPVYTKTLSLNINNIESFIDNNGWLDLVSEVEKYYDEKCKDCNLYNSCYGVAINQVQYHIGDNAGTEASCEFFREWIRFLDRPIFVKSFEKFKIVSVVPIDQLFDLIAKVENYVEDLESKISKLHNPITIVVLEFRDEFLVASRQSFLPDWSLATTCDQSSLLHLGSIPSLGLKHELAHLFLNQHVSKLPNWFVEGVCEWLQDTPYIKDKKDYLQDDVLLNLLSRYNFDHELVLIEHDSRKPIENFLYNQARIFVENLFHEVGKKEFIQLILTTKDLESDIFKLTGRSVREHLEKMYDT